MTKENKDNKVVTPKNITLTKLRKEAKEINTMEYFDLDDDSRVGFYPIFSFKKIEELEVEMMDIIQQAAELDLELNNDDTTKHILFLIIKHFTHLNKHINSKYENQVDILNTFIETGFFSTMIDEVFMPEEMDKVFTYIGKVIGRSQYLTELENSVEDEVDRLKAQNVDDIEEVKEIINERNETKDKE